MRFSLLFVQSPPPAPNPAPLVNSGAQDIVYIGIFGLAIALVVVIGVISRRIEYAIVFAAILSAILIALLWLF